MHYRKGQLSFCNCHRMVSNGHIAPVVDNYLIPLFDSSFILCIIIYNSQRTSVTSPKQCISSPIYSFIVLFKVFLPNILFYTCSVFINQTAFSNRKVLTIYHLLLKYYFKNEEIRNYCISYYLL